MKKEPTEIVYAPMLRSFILGMGGGFMIFAIGALAILIPFIGILMFFIALPAAFIMPFAMLLPRFRKTVRGRCPRCKSRLIALAYFRSIQCKVCLSRILITPEGFELV